MKQVVFTMALMVPIAVHAGGNAWRVEVLSVAEAGSEHSILLRPKESLPLLAACSTVTVRASYGWHWWQREKPMKKSEHRDALKLLQDASVSRQEILFGEVGEGLEKRPEACVLISRGLRYVEGAVYSFYKWP